MREDYDTIKKKLGDVDIGSPEKINGADGEGVLFRVKPSIFIARGADRFIDKNNVGKANSVNYGGNGSESAPNIDTKLSNIFEISHFEFSFLNRAYFNQIFFSNHTKFVSNIQPSSRSDKYILYTNDMSMPGHDVGAILQNNKQSGNDIENNSQTDVRSPYIFNLDQSGCVPFTSSDLQSRILQVLFNFLNDYLDDLIQVDFAKKKNQNSFLNSSLGKDNYMVDDFDDFFSNEFLNNLIKVNRVHEKRGGQNEAKNNVKNENISNTQNSIPFIPIAVSMYTVIPESTFWSNVFKLKRDSLFLSIKLEIIDYLSSFG
jgi:hypothetical protein